jgi:hypothetical protein
MCVWVGGNPRRQRGEAPSLGFFSLGAMWSGRRQQNPVANWFTLALANGESPSSGTAGDGRSDAVLPGMHVPRSHQRSALADAQTFVVMVMSGQCAWGNQNTPANQSENPPSNSRRNHQCSVRSKEEQTSITSKNTFTNNQHGWTTRTKTTSTSIPSKITLPISNIHGQRGQGRQTTRSTLAEVAVCYIIVTMPFCQRIARAVTAPAVLKFRKDANYDKEPFKRLSTAHAD